MRARYVIEGARWSEMKGQSTFDGIDELFALGMSAARLGDRTRVEAAIEELTKASSPGQPAELREQAEIMLREMQAMHLFAQGRQAEAPGADGPRDDAAGRACRSRSGARSR